MAAQRVIVLASGKPGTGKSTVSGFLAHALAERGHSTLAVDADPPGSLLEWSDFGDWSLPVVGLAVRTLYSRLAQVASGYEVVVVDAPPLESGPAIVRSALRVATDVIVPVMPSPIVLHRLAPIVEAMEDVESLRNEQPRVVALLNAVVSSANSGPAARAALTDGGWRVLTTEVTRREMYTQAWGSSVSLRGSAFSELAGEIMGLNTKGRHRK